MHDILKRQFLPTETVEKVDLRKGEDGRWALDRFQEEEPVSTTALNTAEFAVYMEKVINVAAGLGLDVYESYLEWHGWLAAHENPLAGTYADDDDYRRRHPVCEFCGADIEWEGRYLRGQGELMHGRSVGAGGADEDTNRIHSCVADHREQHAGGWEKLVELYPHMEYRIKTALDAPRGENSAD